MNLGTVAENKKRYVNIRKDPYYGHRLLDIVENIMTELKALIDIFLNGENISECADIQLDTLDFYNDVLNNLYNPLLIFQGAIGKIKYAELSLTDNLTNVFQKLQEAYNCVILFDNVNRETSIYKKR